MGGPDETSAGLTIEEAEIYRTLATVTNDATYVCHINEGRIEWLDGYEGLTGFAQEAAPEDFDAWLEAIDEGDRERVSANVERVEAGTGDVWEDEYGYRTAGDKIIQVRDRGRVVREADGSAVAIIGGLVDITAHKRSIAVAREQAQLLDLANDAIWVVDAVGSVVFWNESAVRIFGWSEADVLGRDAASLLRIEPTSIERATEALERSGEWSGELGVVGRDGQARTLESSWTRIGDQESDGASKTLVIGTDVTRRKELEQRFLRTQRAQTFGTLAGGVAHDLNNALVPILLTLDDLLAREDDPGKLERLRTIDTAARRGASMVRQLLHFTHGGSARRRPLNVTSSVEQVLKIAADTFPKNVALRFESEHGEVDVAADPTQLHQVLLNLCINSRDAMPSGGTLTIRTAAVDVDELFAEMHGASEPGHYVRFEVEDTGTGMTVEMREQVFEPFFTTKPAGQGTGLGLPTVASIVQQHGGFIDLDSTPNEGTRFRVFLRAATAEEAATEQEHDRQAGGLRGRGETILIVDDEPAIREANRRSLQRYGYRVLLAEHGAEAVSMFASRPTEIDLVVTDMAMPIMEGPATIVALKALDPTLPIIGASGLNAGPQVDAARAAGMDDFLPKPYTAHALVTLIATVLGQCPTRQAANALHVLD
ncbi:MAG: ATP-binding protein [Nannocystaceae bacterium]|nr:ATP-binding protein [bacterium]